jgi:hypothetical protein
VIRFNKAADTVMEAFAIDKADVYEAVMKVCPETTGPPDLTYDNCSLQSPHGVHFPGHYDVLVQAIYPVVTGSPMPPQPSPAQACAAVLNRTGCVGAKGKGAGAFISSSITARCCRRLVPSVLGIQ